MDVATTDAARLDLHQQIFGADLGKGHVDHFQLFVFAEQHGFHDRIIHFKLEKQSDCNSGRSLADQSTLRLINLGGRTEMNFARIHQSFTERGMRMDRLG